MPYLRRNNPQCVSSGQKTWLYLSFQGRGLRRALIILLSPPPSCHFPELSKNQWHVVYKWFSSHILGLLLILVLNYMTSLTSGNYRTWQGSRLCSIWRAPWYYTVTLLTEIESGWGDVHIGLRIRASLGSSGTQWGLGLIWPPGRWHMMLPYPVIDRLSDPK